MTDEDDELPTGAVEVSEEEIQMRKVFQPGRINDPERKAARIRARLAAERAANAARSMAVAPTERFVLADNHSIAKAAGLTLPGSWLSRLWARILRWFR